VRGCGSHKSIYGAKSSGREAPRPITFDGPELQFFQPGAKASACTGLQASAAIAKAVAINLCFVRIRHAPFRLEGRRKFDAPNFPEDLKLFAHRHIRSSTPRHLAKSLSQQQISAPPLCKTFGSSIEMRRSAENQLHSGTETKQARISAVTGEEAIENYLITKFISQV
jgi:hypothetical protein